MKRTIKIFALLLCLILMATTLSSCKQLDSLKDVCAYWTDETHTDITYKGNLYKKLPYCEHFYPVTDTQGYLVEEDYPILLAGIEADIVYFSPNSEIIKLISNGGNDFYCAEEKCSEYASKIANYKLDNYCILVYKYDILKENYDYCPEILNEDAQKAIDETLNTIPTDLPNDSAYKFESSKALIACDITTEFRWYNYEIGYMGNEVYIINHEEQKIYSVADKNKSLLLEIIKK